MSNKYNLVKCNCSVYSPNGGYFAMVSTQTCHRHFADDVQRNFQRQYLVDMVNENVSDIVNDNSKNMMNDNTSNIDSEPKSNVFEIHKDNWGDPDTQILDLSHIRTYSYWDSVVAIILSV
ncbi:hypothetical protein PHYBLDRAFT_64434 [Phycomyces blakesleeanus NRRL 1555(-)]|uniref:Uncharacterized protein n=1 Tax=Phycomyces blakesleeanus (strain ATCC 8743b / DSM 1359 / FGSC 10004 / NBRC 33097 / NRRL 1555) TaxID=763407 RepID=A0A162UIP1_PHYB8|nr:hypothetical protein PHYBLDRAFT_64434 [Phycomyces blakesleeanus NRRL 1555(-)]OAD75523.1 hypothetical protein PHYBLDRAFT_64434 [Phycomyces blakesleeanus NRRL 1555(-)]|eukprot:XP_018293563.1 hypothetical protein PHYBLDRAFT_64434 [Phycomyces blakesleeanus NRRL 1555(-)]